MTSLTPTLRDKLSWPAARGAAAAAAEPAVSAFDPPVLAADLAAVRAIYASFFAQLPTGAWDQPLKRGAGEWTLRETVAHLCALTGAGLESIEAALHGVPYHFDGLADRFQFGAFNQRGIDAHLPLPGPALAAEFLGLLDQASAIASQRPAWQLQATASMPIYNRPLTLVEALCIIQFHAALNHAAQVAEPAGLPPLWTRLAPDACHRVIARTLRALSLLYRTDLGRGLQATFAFRVGGAGGGHWHIAVSPEGATSGEGAPADPSLTLAAADTATFCQMFTGRLNLPLTLLTRRLRLGGDLRLFARMGSLFSVDATH